MVRDDPIGHRSVILSMLIMGGHVTGRSVMGYDMRIASRSYAGKVNVKYINI